MNNQVVVSIIIPTYNRADLLGETLESILVQTYTYWECIVVDDGSTDDTEQVVLNFANKDNRFQYYKRPDSHLPGGNAARNYGFEQSRGEYIQWFDSDDIMLPDFLNSKLRVFTTAIQFVVCSGTIVSDKLEACGILNLDELLPLYKSFVLWRSQITTNCVLFRRNYLLNKELFNEQIRKGQEAEFFSRIFFKLSPESYSILNVPLFLYRQHESSISNKSKYYSKVNESSLAFNYVANIKRAHELQDLDIFKYFYDANMKLIFSGIANGDRENVLFILNGLKSVLPFSCSVQLNTIIKFCLFTKKRGYKIKKYAFGLIKNHKF